MDDTLKALRAAVRARTPAPRRAAGTNSERRAGAPADAPSAMAGPTADSVAAHPAPAPPPADDGAARNARRPGTPRAEQISLFSTREGQGASPRTRSAPVPPSPRPADAPKAQIDQRTAALMEAYERGAWHEVAAPQRPVAPPEPPPPAPPPEPSTAQSAAPTRSPVAAASRVAASTGTSPSLTGGHRTRLRARFDRGETLADYELVELLLFRSLPRRDTKPIAKALIDRFGTFAAAVGAPADQLRNIDGIGPAVVTDFRLVRDAAERFALDDLKRRPVLSSTDAVVRYYRTKLRTAAREELHVMFVDKKNRMLASECLGVGTVDHTPVYPRELLKRALDHAASAIILVHNHPSGDPTPSRADIAMTKKVVEAASALSIVVHDHLIVAEDGYTSLRAEHLL